MTRSSRLLVAALTAGLLAGARGGAEVAPPGSGPLLAAATDPEVWTADELARTPPPGPNPWLAFLPAGAEPDWSYWRAWADWRAGLRYAARAAAATGGPPPEVAEAEPPGVTGENDLPLLAEPLAGVGSRAGEASTVLVRGHLREPPAPLAPSAEPDGSIPLARPLALAAGEAVAAPGVVGDGGGAAADFDFYAFDGLAGQLFEVAVTTPEPLADLDPIVALYDAAGTLIDLNDNRGGSGLLTTLDSYLAVTLPADGAYFAAVGGHNAGTGIDPEDMFPSDPFDPGSAPAPGSLGIYDVAFALDAPDPGDLDWLAVELRAGDAVGAVVRGGALRVALADPAGTTRVSSLGRDLTGVYPESSPLPGGGEAAIAYVADAAGRWTVGIDRAASFEDAAWELELTVLRPPLDRRAAPARQVVFVDFDGATLDAAVVGGPPGEVTLSPLAAFLGGWGLAPAAEDALVDRVLAAAAENLDLDLRAGGLNGDFEATGRFGEFDVELRNSRDHADPWGQPWVSRVIVGGSRAELGIQTIGIAESIDVGDFAGEETAVVLLDLLSGPAGPDSLNAIARAPGVPIEELVGIALGNLVAHEAGHFLANFHTERDLGPPSLMDRGGRLAVLLGLGGDGAFGTADDLDVDFGDDAYSIPEGFTGTERTLQAISFGLPAAGPRPELALLPRALDFGAIDPAGSAERTLAVSNEGTAPLTVSAAAIGGPDAGRFELLPPRRGAGEGGAPFTLAPGERRELGLRFVPGGIGRRAAFLTLLSDDPAAPAHAAPLAGQGGVPEIVLTPAEHDFGDLIYGDIETHADHPFTIANPGQGPLTVSAFGFTGPNRGAFRVLGHGTVTVPAGGSRQVTVRYRPGGLVGAMTATLAALSNDPAAARTGAALAGRALGPDVTVEPPAPFSFGSVRRFTVRERTFTVGNAGLLDLHVTAADWSGAVEELEIVSGGPPFTLAPGAERELVIAFQPLRLGGRRAELRLASDDPDEDPLVMAFFGEGVEPSLAVTPDSHRFTAAPGGEPVRRFFRVVNAGGAALTVSETEPAGPDAAAFTVDNNGAPFTLAPGGERLVRVAFQPQRIGLHEATLRIVSTDPERPEVHLGLIGNGVP